MDSKKAIEVLKQAEDIFAHPHATEAFEMAYRALENYEPMVNALHEAIDLITIMKEEIR